MGSKIGLFSLKEFGLMDRWNSMSKYVNIDAGAQNRWKVSIFKHNAFVRNLVKGCIPG